jgi:peptidoglycan/LPS O-acetylase OafA/YrhL
MSGQFLSSTAYLVFNNYNTSEWNPMFGEGPIDPSSAIWSLLVETDPIYLWFLASVTPMTARKCRNRLKLVPLSRGPLIRIFWPFPNKQIAVMAT